MSAVVGLPPVQVKVSCHPEHPKLHPSPSSEPSSQCSLPALLLSPQVVMHLEGVPEQVKPFSTVQVELHPSPFPTFESSHASVMMTPSPHLGVHTEIAPTAPVHVQAELTDAHPALHPALLNELSHFSFEVLIPSPHTVLQF